MSVDFDHHTAEHARDPYHSLGKLRDQCPFLHSTQYGGFWVATGWEQIVRIASDPETFTAGEVPDGTRATHIPREPVTPILMVPTELEPPEFTWYRRLVQPHASPAAVAKMEAGIHYWVDWCIDQVCETGSMSVPSHFGTPAPTSITVDWLGLPPEDWWFYWSAMHNPNREEYRRDSKVLADRLYAEVDLRRREPRRDLLTDIANGQIDGKLIDPTRAVGTTLLLLAGGTVTTGDLFAGAVVHMGEHPEVHQRLIDDDRFMRTATEEYLRVVTPVLSNGRVTKCPVEVEGNELEAQTQIMLGWAGGNRDPKVFPEPDEVNLERWPNRHLGFGVGPHRCLGSNLARAMFRVMTRRFLQRLPDFRVVAAEPVPDRGLFAGFARLDVEFTPTPRLLPEGVPPTQFESLYADREPVQSA